MYPILVRNKYGANHNLYIKFPENSEIQNVSMSISLINLNETLIKPNLAQESVTSDTCINLLDIDTSELITPITQICLILVNNINMSNILPNKDTPIYINTTQILVKDTNILYTFDILDTDNLDKQAKDHIKNVLNIKSKNISKIVYAGQYSNCATYVIGIIDDTKITRLTSLSIANNDNTTFVWHCYTDFYNPFSNPDVYNSILTNNTQFKNNHLDSYLQINTAKIYIRDIYSLYYES